MKVTLSVYEPRYSSIHYTSTLLGAINFTMVSVTQTEMSEMFISVQLLSVSVPEDSECAVQCEGVIRCRTPGLT